MPLALAVDAHLDGAVAGEDEEDVAGAVLQPQPGAEAGDRALVLDRPDAAERELARLERRREGVAMRLVLDDGVAAVAGDPLVAEIALRGHQPLRALVGETGRAGRVGAEQRPDRLFRLGVLALAEVEVADAAAACRSGTSRASTGCARTAR